MQLDRPFSAITPTVDGDVLLVLARAEAEFTPATVQRLCDRHSVDGVRKALNRLAEQGVVTTRVAGRAMLYSLNRDHLLAPLIVEMAESGRKLVVRIATHVATWTVGPVLVAVFGSAAGGEMRVDSDIDLLVVRSDEIDPDSEAWRSQVVELESAVAAWTGNDTRVLEFSLAEARQRSHRGVLSDVVTRGIPVVGDMSELTRPVRKAKANR